MEVVVAFANLIFPFQTVMLTTLLLLVVGVAFGNYVFRSRSARVHKRLPPGSLGLPMVGESLSFLSAQKSNKTQEWFESRIATHGPVFKTSLMGKPTVVITGSAGNRFLFAANDGCLGHNQPDTVSAIMGERNTFNLGGSDHKLIRGAMTSFLKPEVLRRYVAEIDSIIKEQLFKELDKCDTVRAVPLLKRVTFNVACSVLFGLPIGKDQDRLFDDFTTALRGMWSLQIDLPGTAFGRAMSARRRIHDRFSRLVRERRSELSRGTVGSEENVVSAFVNLRDDNGEAMSEDMLVDNMMTLMIGSHDTNTILLAHFFRLLARDKAIYRSILEEQERIVSEKEGSEGPVLTWNDIQKMKYTWNVAQELMRITPPVFANFRLAIKDTTFGGFDIPKGWQALWVAGITHMDESIFAEPFKFDPSRFEAASKSYPPYSYVPFGAGPRICPGSEFARVEVLILIHHLVTNYEWSEMVADEPIIRDPMPYPAMGLPIKLHRKKI